MRFIVGDCFLWRDVDFYRLFNVLMENVGWLEGQLLSGDCLAIYISN